jgi:threonine dehydratase
MLVEAQDESHAAQIISDLQTAGYSVRRGAGGMEFE